MRSLSILLLVACASPTVRRATNCQRTSDCSAGLFCVAGSCRQCGDNTCDAALLAECTLPEDCPSGQTCYAGRCFAGCQQDGNCDAGLVCSDDGRCVAGCRSDVQCPSGELCLDKACVDIDNAWLPGLTITPATVTVYVGEAVPSVTVTVTPGPHDRTPPRLTFTNIDPRVIVRGDTATLNDTSLPGEYAFTANAVGRAGKRSQTFVFNVRTDSIYAYMRPVDPNPTDAVPAPAPGLFSVQSDGSQLHAIDVEDPDEDLKQGVVFTLTSQAGRGVSYMGAGLPSGDAGWFELRSYLDGNAARWFRIFSQSNQALCTPGAFAPSGQFTCAYPIVNLTSDLGGQKIAFEVTKSDVAKRFNPLGNAAQLPGAVFVLDTTVTAPASPTTWSNPLDPPAQSGLSVLSRISEPTQPGQTQELPAATFSAPSLSADGTRLGVLVRRLTGTCTNDNECGERQACNSHGVCRPKACLLPDDCDPPTAGDPDVDKQACTACVERRACTADKDCEEGRTCSDGRCTCLGGAIETPYEVSGVKLCCQVGGGLCAAVGSCEDPGNAECGVHDSCYADQGCVPNAEMRYEIYDTTNLSAPVLQSAPLADLPISSDASTDITVPQLIMFPRLVADNRVAYFDIALLRKVLEGPSGAILSDVSSFAAFMGDDAMWQVVVSGPNLDFANKTIVSPSKTGGAFSMVVTEAPRTSEKLKTCLAEAQADPSCDALLGAPTGTTGCVKAMCWQDCADSILHEVGPSGQLEFQAWCETTIGSDDPRAVTSFPLWMNPSPDGEKLLVTAWSWIVPMGDFTSAECAAPAFTAKYCGAAASSGPYWDAFVAPNVAPMHEETELISYDIRTGTRHNLLAGDFRDQFVIADAPISIMDPHFIAQGRQVAFSAGSNALVTPGLPGVPLDKDDPNVFVVNADGSNARRILDKRHISQVAAPGALGIFGCASCQDCAKNGCYKASGIAGQDSLGQEVNTLLAQWAWLLFTPVAVRNIVRWGRRREKK